MLEMDWHIHSHHSPCSGAVVPVADIVRQAAQLGVTEFGLTDHLHCRLNIPSLEASRQEYDAQGDVPGFHFGVEVSCLREWDLVQNDARGEDGRIYGVQEGPGPDGGPLTICLPQEVKARLRIEYVIGGAHWRLGAPLEREAVIRSYHRQNMFLAQHPRVDVVAHPWWWAGEWRNDDGTYTTLPWLDDFTVIPKSMHLEFAAATKQNGTAVEINAAMFVSEGYPPRFCRQYRDYFAMLKQAGVTFAVSSDAHGPGDMGRLRDIDDVVATLGVRSEDLWRPGIKMS